MEETGGVRRETEIGHGPAAARLAEDGDLVRVPPELRDVDLDPLQGGHQVTQALITLADQFNRGKNRIESKSYPAPPQSPDW